VPGTQRAAEPAEGLSGIRLIRDLSEAAIAGETRSHLLERHFGASAEIDGMALEVVLWYFLYH
jgi:hypothetical protein